MKATIRKRMEGSDEPQLVGALHAIASEIQQMDDEIRASESERGVPPHEIGGGQLGFFIVEIENIYKATKNPAFAYEIVAICLRHKEEVPEWAARIVAKGLEKLITAGSMDESTALDDPLYLLGLRRKPGKQHVFRKYRTEKLGVYTKRMRSHASDARDKVLRRKTRPYADAPPNHFRVKGKRVW